MELEKIFRTSEALRDIGISPRRLVLWENNNKFFKIKRDSESKNRDRLFTQDDIELLKWIKKRFEEGFSSDAIRLAIEFYQTGKIESVKWYK